jgi:hypothetical protein
MLIMTTLRARTTMVVSNLIIRRINELHDLKPGTLTSDEQVELDEINDILERAQIKLKKNPDNGKLIIDLTTST